jgi:hypothetical protein
VGYDKLQELAKRAMEPSSGDGRDESRWLQKLQHADPQHHCRIVPTSNTGYRAIAVDAALRSDKRDPRVAELRNSLCKRKLSSEDFLDDSYGNTLKTVD